MKKLTIFIVLVCLFSYLKAQDENSETFQERIDKLSKDFLKDFELKKLDKLPDFNFPAEDMQDFQKNLEEWQANMPQIDRKTIERWQEKNKNLSKELAMNVPDLEELSHNFLQSYSYSIDSYNTVEEQQNDDQLFNALSDIKGVEVVYISKSLLGMAANMNIPGMNMNVNGMNMSNIMSKLESLQIFSTEESGAMKKLKSEAEKLVRNGKYETLMFVKDEESKTEFYMNRLNNQKSEMLMISNESDEISIIRFTGSFTIKDLQELTKDKKK